MMIKICSSVSSKDLNVNNNNIYFQGVIKDIFLSVE